MVEPAIFGPIDAVLAPVAAYIVLLLVIVNMGTRLLAYRRHRREAEDGAEAVTRYPLHELTNVLLVLMVFYFTTLHRHDGIDLSLLVVGTLLADFFEFEARNVEARQGVPLDLPKGAIFASLVALTYAAYVSLFYAIAPVWNAIV